MIDIVDKTLAQLVRNRVHELTDIVMDINAKDGPSPAEVRVRGRTVELLVSEKTVKGRLPSKSVSCRVALDDIENLIDLALQEISGSEDKT